jgi:hypothetical protein
MIDLISYEFREDVSNNKFNVSMKYTDGKNDNCWVSCEMMDILGKDEILELLKGLHKF